jgi:DNA-binding MarR family transcriptional regulator
MNVRDAVTPAGDSAIAPEAVGSPASAAVLDEAGQALFRLGRLFARPPQHQAPKGRAGQPVELSRILVVQAIAAGPDGPGQELTVGTVAARLDIDPSTASRLVAETIRDGYLARTASPADARRVRLELTAAGRALAADARRYQRAVFDHVTRDWSDEERRDFARLFIKFAAAVAEARTNPGALGDPTQAGASRRGTATPPASRADEEGPHPPRVGT